MKKIPASQLVRQYGGTLNRNVETLTKNHKEDVKSVDYSVTMDNKTFEKFKKKSKNVSKWSVRSVEDVHIIYSHTV